MSTPNSPGAGAAVLSPPAAGDEPSGWGGGFALLCFNLLFGKMTIDDDK